VVAVIGRPGVGKSTIIRKAFKTWGLDEPCSIGKEDPERRVLSYSARVETGQPPRMRIVQILEIDLQALQVDEGKGHAWPRSLVRVDGAMICYDALDGHSIAGLAEVISMSRKIDAPGNND
jgi:GTPase SAR1 family protein